MKIEDWRMKVRNEKRKWWEEEIKNQKEQKGRKKEWGAVYKMKRKKWKKENRGYQERMDIWERERVIKRTKKI